MTYPPDSPARRLLDDEPGTLALVVRWISIALTAPRYWSLRSEWPDLVQEVLARLVASLKEGRYDSAREFHWYVAGIVRNTALQALERAGARRDGVAAATEIDARRNTGERAGEDVSMRQAVRRVLDEASEDCRELMRAYYLEEKGYEEIAVEFSIPVGTVKSRLNRCLDCARRSFRVAIRRPAADPRRRAESQTR
ncbi:MAG TPA: sigma-70 family RNA polymerase sigma factor, partial [Patescibacteria group bacterium]|nr:sigma-70 family RNA polymerase sigma factor [Patescibacteria group bacterium]